jgi:hypothetical protein
LEDICRFFAFDVMVKHFKNTALLDPVSEGRTALRAAGNYFLVATAFRPGSPELTA